MNRLFNRLTMGVALLGATALLAACSTANTAPPSGPNTPTPTPTAKFSNETYAAALRTASVKLRGKLPDAADLQSVLASGQPAYEQVIDKYLDPAQNPLLGQQIRGFYNAVFLMGSNVTVDVDGTNTTYNDDEPPNLAAFIFLNDKPVTEMLTADYCVNNNFQMYASGATVDGSTADANGCPTDSAPIDQRAGIISQKPFLAKFGSADTVNVRRMSVIHQMFDCAIYPDPADVPLVRTNDTTADPADANNVNSLCAVDGCPDNGQAGVTMPAETCGTEMNYPCNNNGTLTDATDDFPDPSLGSVANDPVGPSERVSKKYQSKLAGSVGQACADCHGSLNTRRAVMIPYDPVGRYDMNRTIMDVETPDVNADKDYCGTLTPGDTSDDIDPNSADCKDGGIPTAQYFGEQIHSLKEYGAAVMKQPRFFDCMTTRHYDFVLGKTQGELGLQAAGGSGPASLDPATLSKYRLIYEASGWNTREFMRTVFKGDEFLTSQM